MNGDTRSTRRRFLRASGAAAAVGLAGCTDLLPGGEESGPLSLDDFRGSGPLVESRPEPQGTSMDDLSDLDGTLTVYVGGGEGGLYRELVDLLERKYDGFTGSVRSAPSTQQANTIVEEMEGGSSPTDVFWSIDASSLGTVAEAGHAVELPDEVLDPVGERLRDSQGRWVGVAGRARAVPYNTEQFSGDDLPDSVYAFAEQDRFADAMGWAPTYGAFKSFVAAMILQDGESKARSWLEGMQGQNVTENANEYLVSNSVAAGELGAGFANHYYALRVKASQENAPVDLAFTRGDAGALVNVSGTEIIQGTEKRELAVAFVRHLLTAEAQEFFATRTYAYPMIPGVQPVAGLPTIDELQPPDVDLTELSDLDPALALMREVGVL